MNVRLKRGGALPPLSPMRYLLIIMLATWSAIYVLLVCGVAWADELLTASLAPTGLICMYKLIGSEENDT